MKEYERIERLIIAEIEDKRIKDFLPSERKLAAHYNTSRINIKQAVKRLIDRKIVHFASPRRLAVSSPNKSTKRIAFFSFLNTDWKNIKSPIFRDSISSALASVPDGYECNYYCGTVEDEARILKQLLKEKIDGIIVIPHAIGYYLNNIELYSELQKNDCKVVFMLRNIKEVISTSVLPDEMLLIEQSVEALRGEGCEHIVMIERQNSWMGNYRRNIFKFRYHKDDKCHYIGSEDVEYNVPERMETVTDKIDKELNSLKLPKDKKTGFVCLGGDQWVLPLWDIFQRRKGAEFKVISEGQVRDKLQDEFVARGIPDDVFINETVDFKGQEMGKTATDHLIALIESNAVYSNTIFIKPDINLKGRP